VKKIINNIEVKVAELVDKYQRVQLQNSNLQKNNDALNKMLQEQEEQIVALKDKVKLMNISKSIDVNKEGVKETRLKINEYVREIDKCIALLNK
tara:strand:+ start:573 stop:854 length:282 start_codon:yes stop_codon:yes gene_type:complete